MNKALLLLICTTLLTACEQAADDVSQQSSGAAQPFAGVEIAAAAELDPQAEIQWLDDPGAVTEIEWDALIPADWQPEQLLTDFDLDSLSDDDPRALELMDKLKALWKDAPVVAALEGQRVKMPGFVVPLEMDAEQIAEFLLVPYYGACIHVPPPPPNQTIHVKTAAGREYQGGLFDTVWVSGTMRVDTLSTDLADAGYRIENAHVEPYE